MKNWWQFWNSSKPVPANPSKGETTKTANAKAVSPATIGEKPDRNLIYSNRQCSLIALIAYQGMSEAKTIYKTCLEYLLENADAYRDIEIIELSYLNDLAVVTICGHWNESKGLALPWDQLPSGCDVWLDDSGHNNYRGRFLTQACKPVAAERIQK